MSDLKERTGAELVDLYNTLVSPDKQMKKWGKSKDILVERIVSLQKPARGAIKRLAISLLCEKWADDAGDAYGLAYLTIVGKIREAFPTAKTTVNCLRWYATRIGRGAKGFDGVLPDYRQ